MKSSEGTMVEESASDASQDETEDAADETPVSTDEPDTGSPALAPVSGMEVAFEYRRSSTHASNQMAMWVEDADGNLVRTVLVTDFTAARRGYRERENALSAWVALAQPDSLSDEAIDAISSATPSSGTLNYVWDMKDDNGEAVPDGVYTVKFEGTLYWESNVRYETTFDTESTPAGLLEVEEIQSSPDVVENRDMISDMTITLIR